MKIEIKNLRFYPEMSEETNAITCDLFIDSKKIGFCRNDGHGGCTDYTAFDGKQSNLLSAENYDKTLPDIEYEWNGKTINIKSTLENIINNEVEKQLLAKEKVRYEKKLFKDCQKSICYKKSNGYNSITWKNYTLAQLLATPVGLKLVQQKIDELKNSGETILNANLVGVKL
jgi:hypothetical protein